jgi:prevent-host-death family protein
MTKVRIAELKARLSEYLRRVRRGHTITVLDRETPVARLVPYTEHEQLSVREPLGRRRLHEIPLPPPPKLGFDVVELLLEERQVEK